MSTALRRTGVNVLGDMPWGAHVCMFYETKEDLLDAVIPFFNAGLAKQRILPVGSLRAADIGGGSRGVKPAHPSF